MTSDRPVSKRMQGVKDRRLEDEGEFDRLGHAGDEDGQRHRQEHAADGGFPVRAGGVIHGQAGGGQAEHHHREEAAHEGAGGGIAGEEAIEVAGHAVISRR